MNISHFSIRLPGSMLNIPAQNYQTVVFIKNQITIPRANKHFLFTF
jgi:hypothetical protein